MCEMITPHPERGITPMNTIATNRWNDHHGPAVAELIDRSATEMREHSPGCELIDGLMSDSWDGADAWGSTMDACFALEFACQYHGWPTSPDFSSPHTTGDPDEGYLYIGIRDAIAEGRITVEDTDHARTVLGKMHHALKLAGLDY
jgi:hypothetical protein